MMTNQPSAKKAWILGGSIGCGVLLLLLVGVILLLVLGVRAVFDLDNRLSDEDLAGFETAVGEVLPAGYEVESVYGSGTSCEQLCQVIYLRIQTPEEGLDTAVVREVLTANKTYYESIGKETDVEYCFSSPTGEDMNNDGETTEWEASVNAAMEETGLLIPQPHGREYWWAPFGCVTVSFERLQQLG